VKGKVMDECMVFDIDMMAIVHMNCTDTIDILASKIQPAPKRNGCSTPGAL